MSVYVSDVGKNNIVKLSGAWKRVKNASIYIFGDDNVVEIGERCRLDSIIIRVTGNGNKIKIGNNVLLTGAVSLCGAGYISIGNNTTVGRCSMTAYRGGISIGKYCMFAKGLEIRTTDSHPIYDLVTRKRVNREASVKIDDYVWCGMNVTVVKGAHIKKSSVVALGSIVTKEFAPFCLIGGVPAKVIRRNITWSRWTANESLEEDKVAMLYVADWTKDAGCI